VGALAAAERMQQLQTLIAQVERGPAGFAAALSAAQAGSGSTTTPQTAATTDTSEPATSGSYLATAAYTPTALDATATGTSAVAAAGVSASGPAAAGASAADTAPTGIPAVESAGALASAAPASASGAGAYEPLIEQAAARNGLDPAVLYGLIEQESGFDPNATSSAGALGLTQLMPGTASSLGVSEPLNPQQSIEGGARYLGELLRQFSGNTTDALAAYNAGPGAVQQYGGIPPYPETQQYVSKVLANAAAYSPSAAAGATLGGASAVGGAPAGASEAIA
jgi:soluble lytic murein transglycosylase-like protein